MRAKLLSTVLVSLGLAAITLAAPGCGGGGGGADGAGEGASDQTGDDGSGDTTDESGSSETDDDRDPLNHNTFDLAHADSPDAHAQAVTTAVTSTVIAFLDWHLRARPEAQTWLESDSAPDLLGAGGRWETK